MGRHLRREGLTVIELLVVFAIVAMLLALLLPAIHRARELAIKTHSTNNVREMLLTLHQIADANRGELPVIDGNFHRSSYNGNPTLLGLNVHQTIVTYLQAQPATFPDWRVELFISPADPSISYLDGRDPPFPACSYVVNAQVFVSRPNLTSSFSDGLSQTMFFTERYSKCRGYTISYDSSLPWYRPTFADGGPIVKAAAAFPLPDELAPNQVYPITAGWPPVAQPSRPGATFQVAPYAAPFPMDSVRPALPDDCDPTIPQTPHRGGILVGFGDGSVRTIAPNVAPEVFWALITPRGGEFIPDF